MCLHCRRAKLKLIVLALGWFMSGCRPEFADLRSAAQPQALPVPEGWYSSPAWLSNDELAFVYEPEFLSHPWEDQIVIYTLSTGDWDTLPAPITPAECERGWLIGPLDRLPNGNLGVMYECVLKPAGLKYTLYMWDQRTGSLTVLQLYPDEIAAGGYAFSPDMSQLIQHSAIGAGLNDELYRVDSGGSLSRLFPGFQRARMPTWAPDGQQIAFWGTEEYPGGPASEFTTWPEIEGLFRYPWDLYSMNADGQNLQVLVPSVGEAGTMKWSPQSNELAFAGRYKNRNGLWIFDTATNGFTLLRAGRIGFDWAPAGGRMFIIDYVEKGDTTFTYPAIIDVPSASP